MSQYAQARQGTPVPIPIVQDDIVTLHRKLEAALATITHLQTRVKDLEEENRVVKEENRVVNLQLELAVEQADLSARAMANKKMSIGYRVLYMALVNTYPDLLKFEPVTVNVWKIRENGGWVSESSATKFLNAMKAIGAILYEPGLYSKEENRRDGLVTAVASLFPYPEAFDTRSLEKETAARKKQGDKLKEMRSAWLILKCQKCGAADIDYTVQATCQKCGHVHEAVNGVTNDDFKREEVDPFLDMMPDEEDSAAPVTPAPAVPFTSYQAGKWASNCRNHRDHADQWKIDIAGLTCPVCARRSGHA